MEKQSGAFVMIQTQETQTKLASQQLRKSGQLLSNAAFTHSHNMNNTARLAVNVIKSVSLLYTTE